MGLYELFEDLQKIDRKITEQMKRTEEYLAMFVEICSAILTE